MKPVFKVWSEWKPLDNKVELTVYQDGEVVGYIRLNTAGTVFEHPEDNQLIELLKITRTEPFEEFYKVINR